MSKKYIFLSIFSKITIFACVFCVFSACADTTTCDIDFTPVTGNSWQNGTPNPTNPVEIESVGTKIGNKYQIPVVAQGKNLFDKNATDTTNGFVVNNYITSTGNLVSNTSYNVSEYIKIKPNTTYFWAINGVPPRSGASSHSAPRACWYDENKNFIGSSDPLGGDGRSFTVSSNAAYVRVPIYKGYQETEMLSEGTIMSTSYEPYSAPITTNVYLDEPLRKVGDYADVLDYKKGQIIRNVGVKVFDGTESWAMNSSKRAYCGVDNMMLQHALDFKCSHFLTGTPQTENLTCQGGTNYTVAYFRYDGYTDVNDATNWKAFLAQQYANGTPVIVYYPLATPVVEQIENWSCPVPITDIKIATTKMVEDEFAAAEANLAATVQTIESVVSRTIAQTGQIATLHETKQTRPDESCPANMKCLLVQDEDGTPHWYPIIEP